MYPCAWSYQPDAVLSSSLSLRFDHAYSQLTPTMHKNIVETSAPSSLSPGRARSPACLD